VKSIEVQRQGTGDALIVLLGGSDGGFLEVPDLTEDLLTAGYKISQIAYFGFPEGPRNLSLIDVNLVADAIRSESEGYDCVGVVGVSKGAELALILAAHEDVADATVATVPSHVVWNASRINPVPVSSWVLDGEPMSYVAYDTISTDAVAAAWNFENALALHVGALRHVPQEAIIPVEQIESPVLLQTSLRDQVWPSDAMGRAILARANALSAEHEITLKSYEFDHFLLWNAPVRADLLSFLEDNLRNCQSPI